MSATTEQPITTEKQTAMQEAHQLRLQRLLESGRLTPAASPTPDQQSSAMDTSSSVSSSAAMAAASSALNNSSSRSTRTNLKRRMDLESVAKSAPQLLPERMNYVVGVSTRNPDVNLENDHNLHCLCSFPSRQAAHDWIVKHRLALSRHYLEDSKLSAKELEEVCTADGYDGDEYYIGEYTSLEIIQVPQYASVETAPNPAVHDILYDTHFITHRRQLDESDPTNKLEHKERSSEEKKEEETDNATKDSGLPPSGSATKKRKV